MPRSLRPCLLLAFALVLVAPATGTVSDKRKQIHEKITHLQGKLGQARQKHAVLTTEISRITGRIRLLEGQISTATQKLDGLQQKLAVHERILNRLDVVYRRQTTQLISFRAEYATAEQNLEVRLVEIYKEGQPDAVAVVLSSKSLSGMIDTLKYERSVTDQDKSVAAEVKASRDRMQILQARTKRNRERALAEAKTVADAAWQARLTRDALDKHLGELTSARVDKRQALDNVTESEKEYLDEITGLEAASQRIEAQLRQSGSHGTGVSASGLIWPVNGPVTSPFGMRWGRMHEGIDIGVGYGTPIAAAASGTVVYAGWEEGYGNVVLIDHGNGLATAYGHQSSIAVSTGEAVTQGQVIGYVGCTGHCFGPHLHFEVRINGSAVDPLGYL
jgi:murein DD-endopeptidase MepM/ murein hydrolase activator NlpD